MTRECGDYVTCMYDEDWYIGVIQEVSEEEGDRKVSFMHPKGPGVLKIVYIGPPQKMMLCPSK